MEKICNYLAPVVTSYDKTRLWTHTDTSSLPRFTKVLKSDRNRKHISVAKTRSTKIHNVMVTSVFERN